MLKNIVSIINQKGGVGKTTTAINLAAGLALQGKKILLIDLDPQGNATTGLGLSNRDEEKNIYNLLIGQKSLNEIIQKTSINNLGLIASNVNLSGLEVETAQDQKRAFLLKEIFENNHSVLKEYDFIFIDCPPSLSLLTILSLVVAESLLVPLQTEFFALEGISQLIKTIDRIKIKLNPKLFIGGVLLTMYDRRNKLSGQVEEEARKHFGNKVYETVIPRNVRLSEAPSHGVPCILYDKSSKGSKSYLNFVKEFLSKNLSEIHSAA